MSCGSALCRNETDAVQYTKLAADGEVRRCSIPGGGSKTSLRRHRETATTTSKFRRNLQIRRYQNAIAHEDITVQPTVDDVAMIVLTGQPAHHRPACSHLLPRKVRQYRSDRNTVCSDPFCPRPGHAIGKVKKGDTIIMVAFGRSLT